MSKKRTVYPDGRVAEAFRPLKAEDDQGLAVWFYAGRGKFEFVAQDSENGVWRSPVQFDIPTRTIRAALKLVDSVKKRAR